ncbi:hypothetical protein D3C85_1622120 [compost metagenome]
MQACPHREIEQACATEAYHPGRRQVALQSLEQEQIVFGDDPPALILLQATLPPHYSITGCARLYFVKVCFYTFAFPQR